MIDTTTLINKVNGYTERCNKTNHKPSYKGLSYVLGISPMTISNVVNGRFNGKEYTSTPHITRCIDNKDFEILTALFNNP